MWFRDRQTDREREREKKKKKRKKEKKPASTKAREIRRGKDCRTNTL